jgi:cell division protein FtsI/penicillin-binding protein 2
VIQNRVQPLIALVLLLGAGVVARLFQVQVIEHELWAGEASRLVLKGREQPYRRGRILDAAGRVLARDEDSRTVELVYREFRRAHPLGQVAHARSLLEGRPVPLEEAWAKLSPWAHELVALGPRELLAFARGEGDWSSPGLDPRLRARCAADLAYYLRRLLGFDGERASQREALKKLQALAQTEGERRSFLELAAEARSGPGPAALLAEQNALEERLARSQKRLGTLASWIRSDTSDPLAALVADLEKERRAIEDATAARLFAEASGFVPGRVESDTLLECFDHSWITGLLGWDGQRLAEWATLVRERWQSSWRDGECLPSVFANLAFDPEAERGPADFLARLAIAYRPESALDEALEVGPLPWREVDELAVFDALDESLETDVPEEAHALGRAALPIQLEELREDPDEWRLLPAGEGPGSFRGLLARALAGRGRIEVDTLLELAHGLNEVWELRFQETLRAALEATRRAAPRSALGPQGGLLLAAAGRDRAAERAEFFLKDHGSRARPLTSGELSHDVVYLLTRFESDYPGFRVRDLRQRARLELEGDDLRPADRLIGHVSAPTLEDDLRQRRDKERLRELKTRGDPEERELEELQRLVGEVRLPSEVKGVTGMEAFFEPELTGKNGWMLSRGLADVFGGGDELPVREAVDGQDVVLTLDVGLQAALQRCLRSPSDDHEDREWARNPVAAAVLLSREGDVLAAASEPDDQSLIEPLAEGQRLLRMERTLRKPTFQPPGSVFKVFVATWALDHGLDPTRTVVCGPLEGGGAGYKTLRCSSSTGHGPVDLRSALVQSCNAYFAWLGESFDNEDFAGLCAAFGFGEPTGVRRAPPWDTGVRRRIGLVEDRAGLSLPSSGKELEIRQRRQAANGLTVIEATPMQLARGLLSLARGEKTELRLVQRVGESELPAGARTPLEFSPQALEFVRAAMRDVSEAAHGTAHNALSAAHLGFTVAVKTGSADLESRKEGETRSRVRKHAWVGGWAPAETPELVFVIFEHDTSATSSHGAVFMAREILRQPEVLQYLAARGVDLARVPAREPAREAAR